MSYLSDSFLRTIKGVLREATGEKETPASHLASWARGGDVIQQIATHSISHNYRHNNTDLVVPHEEMRQKAISHMERLHAMARDPVDKTHAADAITHLRNAKVNPKAFPKDI